MEGLFEELRGKILRHRSTIRVVMVLGDRVLTGMPLALEGFVDRTNESIET
jgi:hypothetical protein